MKKNNGYSLIELVATLAIFSILMVAVIVIMRTSLVSYRNGVYESSLQEETQILVNQVGDLLIDATEVTSKSLPYKLTVVNKDGAAESIELKLVPNADGKTNTLYYNDQVLSDRVKSFEIKGLKTHADLTGTNAYDNMAYVEIITEVNGRTYTAQKDIFFRNIGLENPDLYDLGKKEKIITGGGDGTKEIDLLRYDEVNLTKDYGIVKLKTADSSIINNYVYTFNGTDHSFASLATDNFQVDTSASGTDVKNSFVIKCNPTLTSAVTAPDIKDAVLVGIDRNNKEITFKVSTYKVDFVVKDNSLYIDHIKSVNNGWHTFIEVKGIHVNKALKAGVKIEYDPHISKNGVEVPTDDTSKKQMSANTDGKLAVGGKWIGTDQTRGGVNYGGNNTCKICIGVAPDPDTNGVVLTTANDELTNNAKGLNNSNGQNKLWIDMYIAGSKVDTMTYQYYIIGNTLENAS